MRKRGEIQETTPRKVGVFIKMGKKFVRITPKPLPPILFSSSIPKIKPGNPNNRGP